MSTRDYGHGISTGHVHDAGRTTGAAAGSQPWQRTRAVRVVAANARDATECACMLDILGLTAADGIWRGSAA